MSTKTDGKKTPPKSPIRSLIESFLFLLAPLVLLVPVLDGCTPATEWVSDKLNLPVVEEQEEAPPPQPPLTEKQVSKVVKTELESLKLGEKLQTLEETVDKAVTEGVAAGIQEGVAQCRADAEKAKKQDAAKPPPANKPVVQQKRAPKKPPRKRGYSDF